MPPALDARHRRTVLLVILTTLTIVAGGTAVGTVIAYRHLDGRLTSGRAITHVTKKSHRPHQPLNILLLGLDTRACDGCDIDAESGADGSDTTILLHVAADRRSAYGISIPRDALVDRPACATADGAQSAPATQEMWNRAYRVGGAACTARQLEKLSGIYVDHYLALNFAGFIKMVDAVHGVEVCVPHAVDDDAHGIHLDAGVQRLAGRRSLDYVRDRYSTANSDLGRMKRQQAFLASLVNEVFSAGTLTRPARLYAFADALTGSITTDPDVGGLSGLAGLARQLRHADLRHVQFVTVPSRPYDVPRTDGRWGRVEILPASARLWRQVSDDQPLGRGFSSGAISADAPPTGTVTISPGSTPTSTPSRSVDATANGLCG